MTGVAADVAESYLKAGLSVLPTDGKTKRPDVRSWCDYMKRLPENLEVDCWFANPGRGICIVTGAVSGNVECIDFDCRADRYEAWKAKADPGVLGKCVIERTQSGGVHVFYRCEKTVGRSCKLARGVREGKRMTLIETRGEGGVALCAPTEGYALMQGRFEELPVLTERDRDALLAAARELDELAAGLVRPLPAKASSVSAQPISATGGERPGDDFIRRGDFRSLLTRHGWVSKGMARDGNERWVRPGKDSGDGISATLKDGSFYVFSSNADHFEVNRPCNAFQAYAALEHGGDFAAAAKALRAQGYGGKGCISAEPACEPPRQAAGRSAGPADPGPLPDGLLRVPGFISLYSDYILAMAHYPNRVAAFAGALTMLSHLSGRRFRCVDGTRMNLYVVALGNSGVGKECPRACNIRLAKTMEFLPELGDTFATGEGLEDAILSTPAMLFQVDEVDYLFNTVKLKDARAEQLGAMMLKLYSESATIHSRRMKARTDRGAPVSPFVSQPHFVFFGTATPRFFYQSMSERSLENGLMARCLVLELGVRGPLNRVVDAEPPQGVLDFVARIRSRNGEGNLAALAANMPLEPSLRVIGESDEAQSRLLSVRETVDGMYDEAQGDGAFASMALWARAGEKVAKLSALYALSENPENPTLSAAGVDWGWRLVDHLTRRMLYMVDMYAYDGEFDEKMKKVSRILKSRGGHLKRSPLLHQTHFDRDTFDRVLETMCESGVVTRGTTDTGGEIFHLVE